jgi:polysaccharide biosynthesis/export protein
MNRQPQALHMLVFVLCAGLFPRCPAQEPAAQEKPAISSSASVVAGTNSMEVLDDRRKITIGDRVSYRVVEERKPPLALFVTDSGEIEIPLIGRVGAVGKTCKQLALDIREPLEKEYFYKATVIIGLDFMSGKSRGRVYLTGNVAKQGPMEIPADEVFTVSKAILRAGGFDQFANKRKVKLVRKKPDNPAATETIIVDVEDVINRGHTENDPVLNPDDLIVVQRNLFNY